MCKIVEESAAVYDIWKLKDIENLTGGNVGTFLAIAIEEPNKRIVRQSTHHING